jgi:hypothetical protein
MSYRLPIERLNEWTELEKQHYRKEAVNKGTLSSPTNKQRNLTIEIAD